MSSTISSSLDLWFCGSVACHRHLSNIDVVMTYPSVATGTVMITETLEYALRFSSSRQLKIGE